MNEEFRNEELTEKIKEDVKNIREGFSKIREEIAKVVVGEDEIINNIFICLLADAHALLESVPGLGKSLLIETLGRCIEGTTFRRIQFVPDMLPADILGVNVFNPKTGDFYISKGPIFANFILADEINRAPPKTQAALMEVMQERKVSIQHEEFILDKPFLVLATQNPLEQQGVYPLPEAIVDRFFMKIIIDYPSEKEEFQIIEQNTLMIRDLLNRVTPVVKKDFILYAQDVVRKIYISPAIKNYILEIVNSTRKRGRYNIEKAKYIKYGGSPRASIALALASKALALLDGRTFVLPSDVKKVAKNVLRHRIILDYEGRALGISQDEIIEEIINKVEIT
ncbi:MAG: AAA family ATPase [Candidatus Aenigmatarchaeota archaeon]